MKIGLLGENYYPTLGGVQEHIHHLARQLIAAGHQVRVLTGLPLVDRWRGPPDEPWVVRLGPARTYSVMGTRTTLTFGPGVGRRLWRVLRDERFDLVHVHAPCDVGLPMLLYPMYRGPLVATLHSPMNDPTPARRLAAPYYQWVLDRAGAVISVSEAAYDAMSRYARFERRILPNGVDVRALAAGRPLDRFRDGRRNILMLGRLEPRNGPDLMFDALPAIAARHPDVRLIVAGADRDGTAAWEARVPPPVRDRVVFLGPVFEERPDLYATADLCVVPARSGTFSIIVLEALAAGAPVVATPFIHRWETLPHFRPVRVARAISAEAIADEVIAALGEDPTDRVQQGRAAAAACDWSHVAAQVMAVYDEVLECEAAGRSPDQRRAQVSRAK
jgi:phosphatidylinositol alpha-mannosyltransferase